MEPHSQTTKGAAAVEKAEVESRGNEFSGSIPTRARTSHPERSRGQQGRRSESIDHGTVKIAENEITKSPTWRRRGRPSLLRPHGTVLPGTQPSSALQSRNIDCILTNMFAKNDELYAQEFLGIGGLLEKPLQSI